MVNLLCGDREMLSRFPYVQSFRSCFLSGIDGRKQVGSAELPGSLVHVFACKSGIRPKSTPAMLQPETDPLQACNDPTGCDEKSCVHCAV